MEVEVFDRPSALRHFMGDEARLQKALNSFLRDAPRVFKRLDKALKRGDIRTVERQAGALRESAGRLGVEGVEELAVRLLAACDGGDLSEGPSLLDKMEMELEWLRRILDDKVCSGNL
ncbi:MAG: Hpt domain-containing protein [Acidobacteriota bacterium]